MSNSTSYTLRDIPEDVWHRVKIRAQIERRSLKSLILDLLKSYADNEAVEDTYWLHRHEESLAEPGEDVSLEQLLATDESKPAKRRRA
jgi:plasmid stability protein